MEYVLKVNIRGLKRLLEEHPEWTSIKKAKVEGKIEAYESVLSSLILSEI